jgi:Protein of unknown function (DUF3429)
MTGRRQATPLVVLAYGVLGIVPFLAPSIAGAFMPVFKPAAARFLVLYGGLILSFLGGARWGLAVAFSNPPTAVISLAMLPTLAGLALLVLPPDERRVQILGLVVALVVHWCWDITGRDLPAWYPGLRSLLTAGALAGLLVGAVVLT